MDIYIRLHLYIKEYDYIHYSFSFKEIYQINCLPIIYHVEINQSTQEIWIFKSRMNNIWQIDLEY